MGRDNLKLVAGAVVVMTNRQSVLLHSGNWLRNLLHFLPASGRLIKRIMKIKIKQKELTPGEFLGNRFLFMPRLCTECSQYLWLMKVPKNRGKGWVEANFLNCPDCGFHLEVSGWAWILAYLVFLLIMLTIIL